MINLIEQRQHLLSSGLLGLLLIAEGGFLREGVEDVLDGRALWEAIRQGGE